MSFKTRKRFAIIVDDLADNRTLFQAILESVGVSVVTADNGRAGVELVKSLRSRGESIDIIFMDMMMPELGGIGATREIRSAGYKGPILAFSADVSSRTAKLAREAGATHYFVKHTFTRDLAEALIDGYCEG